MGEYRSKVDIVVDGIRERILLGELSPGTQLPQRELANAYGVSPTPVREALQRLESEGLVELDAHRGATVARQDPGQMESYLILRAAIDGAAARLAAHHATETDVLRMREANDRLEALSPDDWAAYWDGNRRLHFIIYESSHSELLVAVMRMMWQSMPGSQPVQQAREESITQHHALLNAIASGDGDAAELLARQHLVGTIG